MVKAGFSEECGSWKTICSFFSKRHQLIVRQVAQLRLSIGIVEKDLAVGRADELQDGLAKRGLAAAAFADQAQNLSAKNLEIDTVDSFHMANDRLEDAFAHWEMGLQSAECQDHLVTLSHRR